MALSGVNDGANYALRGSILRNVYALKTKHSVPMPLEDEINARLRHLSEEIRAFRKNIDQLRRDRPAPQPRADEKPRPGHDSARGKIKRQLE